MSPFRRRPRRRPAGSALQPADAAAGPLDDRLVHGRAARGPGARPPRAPPAPSPPGRWWVLMRHRGHAGPRQHREACSGAAARPSNGIAGLGQRSVSGRSRVPSPAARTKAHGAGRHQRSSGTYRTADLAQRDHVRVVRAGAPSPPSRSAARPGWTAGSPGCLFTRLMNSKRPASFSFRCTVSRSKKRLNAPRSSVSPARRREGLEVAVEHRARRTARLQLDVAVAQQRDQVVLPRPLQRVLEVDDAPARRPSPSGCGSGSRGG